MLRYLLDTNAVIALLKNTSPALTRRVRRVPPTEVGMSSIVVYELFYGAHKSARVTHNLAIVDGIQLETVEFDREDAREAGAVRASLEKGGMPIGAYDILSAGQALARGLTLISRNLREFERVAGLSVQSWED
jgi:tRNA(fMet)-specific endonuclease VapC